MAENVNSFVEVIHMDNKIQIFEDKRIRTAWNEETEEWYFSVSDVVEILTDSKVTEVQNKVYRIIFSEQSIFSPYSII